MRHPPTQLGRCNRPSPCYRIRRSHGKTGGKCIACLQNIIMGLWNYGKEPIWDAKLCFRLTGGKGVQDNYRHANRIAENFS